jgi:hypothetical protein
MVRLNPRMHTSATMSNGRARDSYANWALQKRKFALAVYSAAPSPATRDEPLNRSKSR